MVCVTSASSVARPVAEPLAHVPLAVRATRFAGRCPSQGLWLAPAQRAHPGRRERRCGAQPPGAAAPSGVVAAPSSVPANANGNSSGSGGGLSRSDYGKFVQFLRGASPYIDGHRGHTFVIIVPGTVAKDRALFQALMADIALLHGLGVNVVLVLGAQPQIDDALAGRSIAPSFSGGYRITDAATLEVAVEAAGKVRTWCEQYLSKGPSVPMIRRHTKGEREIHFEPALRVVSGNYITAKRRGVIDGVDYGLTGEVRFVLKDAIKKQLEARNIVLLGNLGFTAAGELLNCNSYDVGLHAAVELAADKLLFLHTGEIEELQLPPWLPLSDAQEMLLRRFEDGSGGGGGGGGAGPGAGDGDGGATISNEDRAMLRTQEQQAAAEKARATALEEVCSQPLTGQPVVYPGGFIPAAAVAQECRILASSSMMTMSEADGVGGDSTRRESGASASASSSGGGGGGPANGNGKPGRGGGGGKSATELVLNLDVWTRSGFPIALATCAIACCKGVKRSHLVDARMDGGLLLELYSRDGVGTMISTDFYEGIRRARPSDLDGIEALLKPLEVAGVLVPRSRDDLSRLLPDFIVVERETKVLGCALLLPLGASPDGKSVAEIGAFCVDPAWRGSGRGDSLLDYVEQDARRNGVERLVLLTTRTADWFQQRDFSLAGAGWSSPLLPDDRRGRLNPARNSQLYVKEMQPPDADGPGAVAPGKRIGF